MREKRTKWWIHLGHGKDFRWIGRILKVDELFYWQTFAEFRADPDFLCTHENTLVKAEEALRAFSTSPAGLGTATTDYVRF